MPAGPGHTHPEDLPRLEVPHPLPAAEEEPDRGVGLVPQIRCKEKQRNRHEKTNDFGGSPAGCLIVTLFFFPSGSNKRSTRKSRAPPQWYSPTPEGGRYVHAYLRAALSFVVLNIETFGFVPRPSGPQTAPRAEIPKEV